MKHSIRQQILEKRDCLSKEEVTEKSQKIIENLKATKEYRTSSLILFYVSFNNEVSTIGLIRELLKTKEKKVLVPYVEKNNPLLQVSLLENFNDLEKGKYNILEPRKDKIKKTDVKKIGIVLVPGIAFDKKGHRIGYGHGYYDRFLNTLGSGTKKIGLAYDFQVVDSVTKEKHDVVLNIVISEKILA